jgi:uncharacterized protein (TIGR01319 family)
LAEIELDILCAEIGSTKTMVSGFVDVTLGMPRLVGQGVALTSVNEGDVCLGLERSLEHLRARLGASRLKWKTMMATCSAAGGLRMAVHGLIPSMTSRAAKETALGAGAIVVSATDGLLSEKHVKDILNLSPKIVLLAGGVDGGERKIVLQNAATLAGSGASFSVIYAGNRSIVSEVRAAFASSTIRLFVTENVYPEIDKLNIAPARTLIHDIFEAHLVQSSGIEKIRKMVDGPILPTPGAVMLASQLLAERMADLVVVDVGGATTDVHSVTGGSPELIELQINPEPYSKRTVEGDLGIYVNAPHVYPLLRGNKENRLSYPKAVPVFPLNSEEALFLEQLAKTALSTALLRHVGRKKTVMTYRGKQEVVEGRDLTAIRYVIGTGGALTRLPHGMEILKEAFRMEEPDLLLPRKDIRFLIDRHYVMAGAGLISLRFPEIAFKIMSDSLSG